MKGAPGSVIFLAVALALAGLRSPGTAAGPGESSVTAWVKANPLDMTLSVPATVRVGKTFAIRATIENHSASPLADLSFLLHTADTLLVLNRSGLILRGSETRHRGALRGQSTSVEWRLKAVEVGGYPLMASASGRDASDGVTVEAESVAALLVVTD